jgi:hypothetical protein
MNMNTTPEQLELAARIVRDGLAYEFGSGGFWRPSRLISPACYLGNGYEIRIKPASFAPIPEGALLHNPDGLTPEQVGEEWRLLTTEELKTFRGDCDMYLLTWVMVTCQGVDFRTYRVPLSTPYPCGSRVVDGKLVKPWKPRFKVGDRVFAPGGQKPCVIERIDTDECWYWLKDIIVPPFKEDELQPYVWTLTRHIPGFRPLRDGEEWLAVEHWNRETLPDGARPLFVGEAREDGDEVFCFETQSWHVWPYRTSIISLSVVDSSANPTRTRRPLPEPAPEPAKVQLGEEDVPPGSVFRWDGRGFFTALTLTASYVYFADSVLFSKTWEWLKDNAEIHRPGNLDANGKPVFEPCWKEGASS